MVRSKAFSNIYEKAILRLHTAVLGLKNFYIHNMLIFRLYLILNQNRNMNWAGGC